MFNSYQNYDQNSVRKQYFLSKNIAAIPVLSDEMGRRRMGTLLQLPEGARLETCGEGFDAKTIKVLWEGSYYYVFLAEVEPRITRTFAAAV